MASTIQGLVLIARAGSAGWDIHRFAFDDGSEVSPSAMPPVSNQ